MERDFYQQRGKENIVDPEKHGFEPHLHMDFFNKYIHSIVNVFPLYDFLNNVFFSLPYCKNTVNTYNIQTMYQSR